MLYLSLTLVLSPIIFHTFYICNSFEDCRSWLVVSTHLPHCTVIESGNTSTVTHGDWESCRVYVYDIVDVRTRVYQGASVPGWHIIQHRQRSFREAVWAKDRTVVWRGVGRKRGGGTGSQPPLPLPLEVRSCRAVQYRGNITLLPSFILRSPAETSTLILLGSHVPPLQPLRASKLRPATPPARFVSIILFILERGALICLRGTAARSRPRRAKRWTYRTRFSDPDPRRPPSLLPMRSKMGRGDLTCIVAYWNNHESFFCL